MKTSFALSVACSVSLVVAACGGGDDSVGPATSAAGAAGSGGSPSTNAGAAGTSGAPASSYPAGCKGLDEPTTYACAEANFWLVFQVEFERRREVWELHKSLDEALPAPTDKPGKARMVFQRGQLGLAMALENQDGSLLSTIEPDFKAAIELDPSVGFYYAWHDAQRLALSELQNDTVLQQSLLAEATENVKREPLRNIPSLTGTLSGLTLASGAPQLAVKMLEGWACHPDNAPTNPWCFTNSAKAPFGAPGFQFHLADAYARVGDTKQAKRFLEAALKADGANAWHGRADTEAKLAGLEDYVKTFTDLGADGPAFLKVYANQPNGCKLCHAKPK